MCPVAPLYKYAGVSLSNVSATSCQYEARPFFHSNSSHSFYSFSLSVDSYMFQCSMFLYICLGTFFVAEASL